MGGHLTLAESRFVASIELSITIRFVTWSGIDFHPADDFPSDDVGYGFDNIGDVLSMPPILLEKYLAAAEMISEEAIVATSSSKGMVKTWTGETLGSNAGGTPRGDGSLILTSESEISLNYQFPRNANFIIRVRACGDQAGPEPVRMAIRIDGKELKRFDVTAPSGKFQEYQFRQNLRGGSETAFGRVSE